MRNIFTIAKRELGAIFGTAIGWLVLFGFLLDTGVFWLTTVSNFATAQLDLVFNPFAQSALSFTEHILVPFFDNCTVMLLMVTPAITMGLFSKEYSDRTMELLLTSPLSSTEIVLGKFLGAMGFIAVLLGTSAYCPAMLFSWGAPELGVVVGGYLSLFLIASSLSALGMLTSSFTESQLVALILAFSLSLALLALGWMGDGPDSWQQRLSLLSHVQDLWHGAVRLSDVTYFVALTSALLFATVQRVESQRWG